MPGKRRKITTKIGGKILYCYCREPEDSDADEEIFWIACDLCEQWFHGDCVGIAKKATPLGKWHCHTCKAIQKSNDILLKDMRELLSSAETKSATKELNAYQIKMQELEAHIQKSDVRCKELALKNSELNQSRSKLQEELETCKSQIEDFHQRIENPSLCSNNCEKKWKQVYEIVQGDLETKLKSMSEEVNTLKTDNSTLREKLNSELKRKRLSLKKKS